MCNIFCLPEKVMPDWDKFQNCVWNNPHGYGLLVKKDGKLIHSSECPKTGNDPQKIYELLDKNKQYQRFLHVRWATEGKINKENTQPFQVLSQSGHDVWFMHNGTFHTYANSQSYGQQGVLDGKSDTLRFCERILRPYARRLLGVNAKNNLIFDLEDPWIKEILDKAWPGNLNRGVLVSNLCDPLYFSTERWKKMQGIGGEFMSSNDDYFDTLKRGPMFEIEQKKKEEQRKKEEEARKTEIRSSMSPARESAGVFEKFREDIVVPVNISIFKQKYALQDDLVANIFQDWDMYDHNNYAQIGAISIAEWQSAVDKSSPEEVVYILNMLTDLLEDVGKKVIQAEQINTNLKKKINLLEKDLKIEREINANRENEKSSESKIEKPEPVVKRAAQNRKATGKGKKS